MGTARASSYGKVFKGHSVPYGALANVDPEVRSVFYYYGYKNDDDIPELPHVPVEVSEVPLPEDVVALREMAQVVKTMLDDLTPKEARVLRMRFGIETHTDMTLEEVGNALGVTRERVRQIEAKAMRKMKHPNRSDALRQFLQPGDIQTTVDKERERQKRHKWIREEATKFMEVQAARVAKLKTVARIPEDRSWIDHLKRTNPELYESLQTHVSSYVQRLFNN